MDVDALTLGCETPLVVQGLSTNCPHCGQLAPTVQRGLETRCSVCGGVRLPFDAPAVNLAGQPAQVGGTVARIVGWLVLAGGLLSALLVGSLFQAIFPAGVFGWILGSVIGLGALGFSLALILGGKKLRQVGTKREHDVQVATLRALAGKNRGVVAPDEAARALGSSVQEADALLTELAKQGTDVRLEVDDDGRLTYVFDRASSGRRFAAPARGKPWRVEPSAPDAGADAAGESDESEADAGAVRRRRR